MPYGITQSYLPPGRGSISRPYPSQYSIYPQIKDERLSRPGDNNPRHGKTTQGQKYKPVSFKNSLFQSFRLVRRIMFNGADRAECHVTLGTEVAYRLLAVLGAEHGEYSTSVGDSDQLVRSEHWVGIVPRNTVVTQLHQTL